MAGLPVPGPGRDSTYQPQYAEQARKLCLLGYMDAELAAFFEIAVSTLNRWKHEHPGFWESINAGKVRADAEVADSLYRRATGEHVVIEKAVKNADGSYQALRLQQFIPGDVTAQRLWLLNRRKNDWRDKQEVEHSGSIDLPSKEERDARVAAQAARADS